MVPEVHYSSTDVGDVETRAIRQGMEAWKQIFLVNKALSYFGLPKETRLRGFGKAICSWTTEKLSC